MSIVNKAIVRFFIELRYVAQELKEGEVPLIISLGAVILIFTTVIVSAIIASR